MYKHCGGDSCHGKICILLYKQRNGFVFQRPDARAPIYLHCICIIRGSSQTKHLSSLIIYLFNATAADPYSCALGRRLERDYEQ